jgi:hypothetical protein
MKWSGKKGNTYIQDAFPNLTADEREFVKTGIILERLMLCLKTRMKTKMKMYLTTSILESNPKGENEKLMMMEMRMRRMTSEFDEMMRLAVLAASSVCMIAMGDNDHDYDLALKALIANGHYTPEKLGKCLLWKQLRYATLRYRKNPLSFSVKNLHVKMEKEKCIVKQL